MNAQREDKSMRDNRRSIHSISLIVLSIFMAVGAYVSDLLIQTHIELKLGNKEDSGLCGSSEVFSCKAAASSEYSELFGLPIAVLGQAFYLCALVVLVWARLSKARRETLLDTLGMTISLSALYSAFLGGVSYFKLGTLCPLCIALYIVNIGGGIILFLMGHIEPKRWRITFGTPGPWSMALIMAFFLIGSQSGYAVRHQTQHTKLRRQLAKVMPPSFHPVEVGQAPVKGEASAALVIEFSDFQCPFCRRFTGDLSKAFESAEDHAFSYAFKHFPLSSQCNPHISRDLHPRACYAALAAICAQEQNQFWPMHDQLFAHQHELEDEDLKKYAEEIGLDLSVFIDCLHSERAEKRLSQDIAEAHQYGVRGTPVFFVNGWMFKGAKRTQAILDAVAQYAYGDTQKTDQVDLTDKE